MFKFCKPKVNILITPFTSLYFYFMKVFELKKRKNLSHAIHAIALVENPAIEEDFIYLSEEGKKAESNIYLSEEKGIIYSPVLIPEQKIKRVSPSGEEYQIFFSKETIEEAAHDMMKAKSLDNFNEEHSDKIIDKVNVVELWLVEDPAMDKATKLGFDVVEGTLMAGIKVDNEEARANIKSGKIKGISIEGLFEDFELVENEEVKLKSINKMNKVTQLAKDFVTKLSEIAESSEAVKLAVSIKTENGQMVYTPDQFVEGEKVFADEAMQDPYSGSFVSEGVKYIAEGGVLIARESVEEKKEEAEEEVSKIQMKSAEAIIALDNKVSKLSESLESANKENENLKAELTKLSEQVENNKTLLSKVEDSTPESVTKLSTEIQPTTINNFLNNRKFN